MVKEKEREQNKPKNTVLERLGGIPENLLEEPEDLSDRDVRKQIIAEKIKQSQDRSN